MGDVNVNILPPHLTVDGELLDFDSVRADLTTTVNGDILKDIGLRAAIGGTEIPLQGHARIDGTADINGTILDKIAARLATTLDGSLLDKINATVGLSASIKELAPFILTLLWTEIPIVKLRFPHDYTFGVSLLGFEFFSLHFRGETKAVTAKNPNGAAGNVDV
jgi:hypothetical protein